MKIQSYIPVRKDSTELKKEQDAQFKKAAKLYEQQFLREMVKAMRKTVKPSGLVKQNFAEKLFREQLDNEYIEGWSKRGGVGMADMIYQQLNERFGSHNGTVTPPLGPIPIQDQKGVIEENPSRGGFKILKSPQVPHSSQFIFEGPKEGFAVTAPWDGQVVQSFSAGGDHRQVLSIDHDNGQHSKIVFEGKDLGLGPGDAVKAGEEIGQTVNRPAILSWKVSQRKG